MRSIDDSNDGRLSTTLLFLAALALLLVPLALFVNAAGSSSFPAGANVTNDAPTVAVDAGQTIVSQASGSASVYVYFNATDTNGRDDLNDTTALLNITKASNTDRSGSCTYTNVSANTKRYNCTLTLWYYDESGSWSINATIKDNSGNTVSNTAVTLSVSVVDSVTVVKTSIGFSGSPGTSNIGATQNPQQLNNTGNQVYASINITGFNFTSGGNIIGVSNARVNVSSSSGAGQSLSNAADVTVTGASLSRGQGNTQNFYFYLDIPGGQAAGTYSAQTDWVLKAIQ